MREAGEGMTAPPADQQGVALVPVPETAVTRSVFLEGATLGLGAAIGGLDHCAGGRFRAPTVLPRPAAAQDRSRPDLDAPLLKPVVHRDVHRRPRRGRGQPADGLRSQTTAASRIPRSRRSRCRASRSSRTTASTSASPWRRTAPADRSFTGKPTLHEHTASGTLHLRARHPGRRPAARATEARTTPRATASPACRCAAQPLRVRDR